VESLVTLVSLTTIAFVATNLDNLILLVTWLLEPGARKSHVMIGLVSSMIIIVLVAYGVGWAADVAAGDYLEYLGYLGLVPLTLGVFKLTQALRGQTAGVVVPKVPLAALGYTTTQLANGGDTIAVFAPLLIDTHQSFDWLILATIAVLVVIWFGAAHWLASQAYRLPFLERYAELTAALVMIVVGLYILADTATDIAV
jgi:cadmium resistance protein CadD (predicted permease)